MIEPRQFEKRELDLETAVELLENLLGASSDLEILQYDQESAQNFLDLYFKTRQD